MREINVNAVSHFIHGSIYAVLVLAPVVRKPISANPRLNRSNPRNKFIFRLNSVPQRAISTIQGSN